MAAPKDYKWSNDTKNFNAQCKVVLYPWREVLNDPDIEDEKLQEAGRLDISSALQNVSFQKNMGSPAGTFSFTLTNSPGIGSQDWKDIIKRGYWCVIYMSQEGDLALNSVVGSNVAKSKRSEAKRIRCIGYIERVGVKATTLENRSIDYSFTVTGRDIGVVYEETNIWHNMFKFDNIMLESIAQKDLNVVGLTTIDKAIQTVHDLFYYPLNIDGAKVNDQKSLLSIGLQWLLPKEMLSDIGFDLSGLSKGTYWGALPGVFDPVEDGGDIYPTAACIAVDKPGDYLSGNAWEQLKRLSVPQYHELFVETRDNGLPRLVYRPIPWGIDNSDYPMNAKNITLYKDLKPVVTVPAIDLYDFDLGEDDHSRYNSFLTTISSSLISAESNVGFLLGDDYPINNSASIRRHGFRPMHVTVETIINNQQLGNGTANKDLLVEFNQILYDYWNPAVFAESGNVVKAGTNDVKIGKVMKFKNDVPYLSTKRYYIEGYSDSFTVDENMTGSWVQEVTLTRGMEEADLKAKVGFANRNVPFSGAGEFTKKNPGSGK